MKDEEKIVDNDHNNNVIHKQQHIGRGKEGMFCMIYTYNICIFVIPCKDQLWVHTIKSNKLVSIIDNSKIIN